MEEFQGKVRPISGGKTVEEVLAEVRKMSHNLREVCVLAVTSEGKVTMRRTRCSLADLALMSATLQANVTDEILDIT